MTRGRAHGFLQKARQMLRHRKTLMTSPLAKWPRLISAPAVRHYLTDIPGPASVPMFGAVWQYLPGGPYHRIDLNEAVKNLNKKYGDVVHEKAGRSLNVIRLYNPHHFNEVYRAEGDFPQRKYFNFLERYNEEHNEGVQGLCTSQDFEWKRLRRQVQNAVHATEGEFECDTLMIAKDFVERIARTAGPSGDVLDVFPEIQRYVSEAAGRICYGLKPGSLGGTGEGEQFVKKVSQVVGMVHKEFKMFPLYRYMPTPSFNRYTKMEKQIRKMSCKLMESAMSQGGQARCSRHMVGQLYSSLLSDREVCTLVTEFFTGIVSMTDSYLAFMLYAIATNDRVQNSLYNELKDIPDDALTSNPLRSIPYLAAVEKEVLRMYPVAAGLERILHHDIVVGGYLIPAGSTMVIHYDLAGKDPRFIANPDSFQPERWLDNSECRTLLPFLSLPFGFGPRSCPARDMAFQQMGIAVTKILQRFRLCYNGCPLPIKLKMVNVPDGPMCIRFTERCCC